jgi:hypothetical protein
MQRIGCYYVREKAAPPGQEGWEAGQELGPDEEAGLRRTMSPLVYDGRDSTGVRHHWAPQARYIGMDVASMTES